MRISIIGGGVVGLFTGYIAAIKGHEAVVYEKEKALGGGASGHNAGVIHMLQTPFRTLKSRLALNGNKLHRIYSRNIGYTMRRVEAYLLSRSYIHRILDRFLIGYLDKYGVRARYIDIDELRRRYPFVKRGVKSGIAIDGYYVVDPMEVLSRLRENIELFGGEVRLGYEVDSVEDDGECISIDGEEYDYVVISAGPYTAGLATQIGINPPIQRYAKGPMIRVRWFTDAIFAELKLFTRNRYTKGGAVIPTPRGDYNILGPGFRWVNDPEETQVSREEIDELINRYSSIIDTDVEVIDAFAGVRVINYPDDDYLISLRDRVVALFGIDSPGFTAAPALAEKVIELVTTQS